MSLITLSFKCANCGSETFTYPGADEPQPDDVLTCAGCRTTTGRYADVEAEMVKQSADLFEQAIRDGIKEAGRN